MSEALKALAECGATVSGGPVAADFKRGWGKHPFVGSVAHYWAADREADMSNMPEGSYLLQSRCGLATFATQQAPLLGPGSFECCTRCDSALLSKRMTRR